jgi:hypothetical protein
MHCDLAEFKCDLDVMSFFLGVVVALFYVRIMFDSRCISSHPPRYCMLNAESKYCPVILVEGSLFLYDYRIHGWIVCLAVLPLVVFLELYTIIGICLVFIVHGLWYDDRFVFKQQVENDINDQRENSFQ